MHLIEVIYLFHPELNVSVMRFVIDLLVINYMYFDPPPPVSLFPSDLMEGNVVNGLSFALTVNRFTPFALLLFHDQPHSNQLTHNSFQKSSFVQGKSQRYPTNCELCIIFSCML